MKKMNEEDKNTAIDTYEYESGDREFQHEIDDKLRTIIEVETMINNPPEGVTAGYF